MKELTGFLQEKFKEMSVEKDPVLGNQSPGKLAILFFVSA